MSGDIIYDEKDQKVIEFIVKQSFDNENDWIFPWGFLLPKETNELFQRRLFDTVFERNRSLGNDEMQLILKNPIKVK